MPRISLAAMYCSLVLGCSKPSSEVPDAQPNDNAVALAEPSLPLPTPEPEWPDLPRGDILVEFEAMRDSAAKLVVMMNQTTPVRDMADGERAVFLAEETTPIGETHLGLQSLLQLQTDWSERAHRLRLASDSVETSATTAVEVVLSRSDSILKDVVEKESARVKLLEEQREWLKEHKPTDDRLANLTVEANQIRQNQFRWNELREKLSRFPTAGVLRMSKEVVAYKDDPETAHIGDALGRVLDPANQSAAELTFIKDEYLKLLRSRVEGTAARASQILNERLQLVEHYAVIHKLLVQIENGDSSVAEDTSDFLILKALMRRVRGKNIRLASTLIDVVAKYKIISEEESRRLNAKAYFGGRAEQSIVREIKGLMENGPEGKAFLVDDFFDEPASARPIDDSWIDDSSIASLKKGLKEWNEFAAYIRKLQSISMRELSAAMSLAKGANEQRE